MRIISRKKLREFWADHPDAEEPLKAWYATVKTVRWEKFADVRKTYGKTVDRVGQCYVFNIHGNHYRLIAMISHDWTVLLVRAILPHQEYSRGSWRGECNG